MPTRTAGQPQSELRNEAATPECPAAAATVAPLEDRAGLSARAFVGVSVLVKPDEIIDRVLKLYCGRPLIVFHCLHFPLGGRLHADPPTMECAIPTGKKFALQSRAA
jgi:hypothetical protein